ncbi:MAG: DUF1573 domain-containing protein [Odoribacteraceae bacterium]|jgi:hypothetical protein|nr:DUF1573 domain-containing protein [Odoribacteraceae bacterium]
MCIKIATIRAVLFCMLIPFSGLGQDGMTSTMTLSESEWNFGTIKEEDGPVSHTFEFTNTGRVAFVIEQVSVSCGCTTFDFTRQSIVPGGKGQITVVFHPENKRGTVLNTLYVTSNKGKNSNSIRIKGDVVPRRRGIQEEYPVETSSGIRFSTLSVNFMYVEQDRVRSMTIGYANPTDQEMTLSFRNPSPNHYFKIAAPKTICAGCRGEITIICNMHSNAFGRFVDHIYPVMNGKEEPYPLLVTAIGVDSRSGVDVSSSACASVEPFYHNFGEVKRGTSLKAACKLLNTGKKPLIVRWVEAREAMSCTLAAGMVIQPGESVKFEVGMNTSEAGSGMFTGSVSFIVNDPLRPMREMRLTANVQP